MNTVCSIRFARPKSKAAREALSRIVAMAAKHTGRDVSDIEMDLLATHNHGCRLDFVRMAESIGKRDNFEVLHDIYGIDRHLNRTTGALENFFHPRFARRSGRGVR